MISLTKPKCCGYSSLVAKNLPVKQIVGKVDPDIADMFRDMTVKYTNKKRGWQLLTAALKLFRDASFEEKEAYLQWAMNHRFQREMQASKKEDAQAAAEERDRAKGVVDKARRHQERPPEQKRRRGGGGGASE